VGHPAVRTQLPLKCLFPTVSRTPLQAFSSDENRFLFEFLTFSFSFDLKTSSYHGPKDLEPPLFNVSHDYFSR